MNEEYINDIKEIILKEKKITGGFSSVLKYLESAENEQEKNMINNQMDKLKSSLRDVNNELLKSLEGIMIKKPLIGNKKQESASPDIKKINIQNKKISENNEYGRNLSELDKEILKRLKQKKKKTAEKKEKKPSVYVKIANNLFAERVKSLIKEKIAKRLERDLIKSNLEYTSISYLSILILTTIVSGAIAVVLFIFFLFFNLGADLPIITRATEGFGIRILKVVWLILVIPAGSFLFMYFYPSLEKRSLESKINQELPFATIHMAAISGSMIEPTKIFSIISSTKEYTSLEKEFNKLLNAINLYGYDIVTALKDSAMNCPSQKLAELYNGLATTITSGGNLYEFFDKRAQNMLFEYRLDKEKNTKTAETSMDIYISVVIAAPMILMLLLMMMKISGLGVALSTSTITLLVVGGVSLINIIFLIFLQLRQPK